MSRIGRKPITVPEGVSVSVGPGRVTVNGPKGELEQRVSTRMEIVEAAHLASWERAAEVNALLADHLLGGGGGA